MLKEATGPINFTMFLNLFGEKLHGENLRATSLNPLLGPKQRMMFYQGSRGIPASWESVSLLNVPPGSSNVAVVLF